MTQDMLQKVLNKYGVIIKQLNASSDEEAAKISRDVQKEMDKLRKMGVGSSSKETKEFVLSLWSRLNDQLFDRYVSACSGNVIRISVPAAVGAAMELVSLFESEGI